MSDHSEILRKKLIVYDGKCMMCSQYITLILEHDKGKHLFVSSKSEVAKALCKHMSIPSEKIDKSICYVDNNIVKFGSSAIAFSLLQCTLLFKILGGLLICIPKPIRDTFYYLISKRRKGFDVTCRVFTREEMKRIYI